MGVNGDEIPTVTGMKNMKYSSIIDPPGHRYITGLVPNFER
jgi:hypothetical protein